MKNLISLCMIFLFFSVGFTSCQNEDQKKEMTQDSIVKMAKEYGVEVQWEPSKDSLAGDIPISTEAEARAYFESLVKLNREIDARNEKNRKRNEELQKALSKCRTYRDTVATFLKFPDIVQMDQAGIEECIRLGLITKHQK